MSSGGKKSRRGGQVLLTDEFGLGVEHFLGAVECTECEEASLEKSEMRTGS